MDLPMMPAQQAPGGRLCVATVVLAATLVAEPGLARRSDAQAVSDVAVKAALLFNFAKFAEWPALLSSASINFCIVGDEGVATALVDVVRGHTINGRRLEVWRPHDATAWKTCHLLYVADADSRRLAARLAEIRAVPILTVSDANGFAGTGGIVELYVDGARMRFAINVDAAERSGLRLSSRLLGLATIVRNARVQ
jgi:hypothetical protein